MDISADVLAPIFRSQAQLRLLTASLLGEVEQSLSDLSESTGVPYATTHREISRLLDSGILKERNVGRSRLISANEHNPVTRPLRQLVSVISGPAAYLKRELKEVPGIDFAFIYGSFAARLAGIVGDDPSDIDVMVVGKPDAGLVYDVADSVQEQVGREVNVTVLSQDEFAAESGFLKTVRDRPTIALVGEAPW